MASKSKEEALEAANKAIAEFMARAGVRDTTVHERTAPAITHEVITRMTTEEQATVVDREIHADHYHISIQPILDEQTLDEQHSHNLLDTEERTFEHDDRDEVQKRLNAEHAKYRNEIVRVDGEKTSITVPIITSEHVHHHVHELIQPVINKRTIEPFIIHTTIPVREVHHNAAQHHATSALAAISLADFIKQGGSLNGREERWDFFEGEPRSIGEVLSASNDTVPLDSESLEPVEDANDRRASRVMESSIMEPPVRRLTSATISNAHRQGWGTRGPTFAQVLQGAHPQRFDQHSKPPTTTSMTAEPPETAGQQPAGLSSPSQNIQGRWNLLPTGLGRGVTGVVSSPARGSGIFRTGRQSKRRQHDDHRQNASSTDPGQDNPHELHVSRQSNK